MNDYYKILGVDELASKSLIRLAYVTALLHAKKIELDDKKVLEIHVAYWILKSYRRRIKKWNKPKTSNSEDERLDKIYHEIQVKIDSGRINIKKLPSKIYLEIRYVFRTLFMGFFSLFGFIISEGFSDLISITIDIRGLIASLIFVFSLLNLSTDWINPNYSYLLIIISIGLIVWHIKEFENNVKKSVSNKV